MKITKENARVNCYDGSGDCWVYMKCAPSLGTKVVEVPKYWRENGKKYEVTAFYPEWDVMWDKKQHKIILRVPKNCKILLDCWRDYYEVERYD